MIKKINKYLIENHPLIWNTKFVWMFGILILMHLIYFFLGYFSFSEIDELHQYDLFQKYIHGNYVWVGILISILLFILWLNQYFKQNAFKSFYPKSNLSFIKEFSIIYVLVFLIISPYLSFTKGLEAKVAGLTSQEEVNKQLEIVNLAEIFTLQEPDQYSLYARCSEVPIFDTLVNPDELLKLFVDNRIKHGYWPAIDKIEDYKNYRDSLPNNYYTLSEYEDLLIKHFPQRENWTSPDEIITREKAVNVEDNSNWEYYKTPAFYNENTNYRNLNSLYNFCRIQYSDKKDSLKYYHQAQNLLRKADKAEIDNLLKQYLSIADQYDVKYRFKDRNWIDYVYNPPYYFVDYELQTISRYVQDLGYVIKKDHVNHRDLQTTLNNQINAKEGIISHGELIVFLALALIFSLLIYTFRTSTNRTWVISLVGMLVLFFVYLCLLFITSSSLGNFTPPIPIIWFFLFTFLFHVFMFSGISVKRRKLITGLNLNWSIWTFPLILPLAFLLYSYFLDNKHDYNQPDHPHYTWIHNNFHLIMYVNFVLTFVYVCVLIPFQKRWQAMPEE